MLRRPVGPAKKSAGNPAGHSGPGAPPQRGVGYGAIPAEALELATMNHSFDVTRIREHFPALTRARAPIYLDNPAGTQVAREAIQAMCDYMLYDNANLGGVFTTGKRSDAMVSEARAAVADFLGAPSASEIVFGSNMTTLTYAFSRAFGRTLEPGDEIVVTRLDHDANLAPWLALEERGVVLRWLDVHPEDCTLDLEALDGLLGPRTRLVT